MKILLRHMTTIFAILTIITVTATDLVSNAASATMESFLPSYSTNSLRTLQGDDGNSLFEVGRSGSQTHMTLKNKTTTNNYVVLTVSAISSAGSIINTNTYSGILPSGNVHTLMNNNPSATSFQVSAVMYSNSMLCNWTAVVNTSTIQASDSKSLAVVTRSGDLAYLSLKNQTSSAHYYDINIDAISSSGSNAGNANANGIHSAGEIDTILNMNPADTYQFAAQMWNNTTATGSLLSNWTATA